MDEPGPRERIPPLRLAFALFLGGALLAMTYVLFDPDLGTEAPLFGELTCRGALELRVANGFGEPYLREPVTALTMEATDGGARVPALFVAYKREQGETWKEWLQQARPSGEWSVFMGDITPSTEVYVEARDLRGERCDAESGILRPQAAEPAGEPTPPSGAT